MMQCIRGFLVLMHYTEYGVFQKNSTKYFCNHTSQSHAVCSKMSRKKFLTWQKS